MIRIICVAYERVIPLQILCDCFLVQTNPHWELNIIYDGPPPDSICEMIGGIKDKRVKFFQSKERNGNYGHPNRRKLLYNLEGKEDDYVLMTNDDNYYVPVFVDMMLSKTGPKVGIVSCNTVHSHFSYDVHFSKLVETGIDMGAFIVRFDVAKTIGFKYDHFSADGRYAKECSDYCITHNLQVVHLPKPLFIHN